MQQKQENRVAVARQRGVPALLLSLSLPVVLTVLANAAPERKESSREAGREAVAQAGSPAAPAVHAVKVTDPAFPDAPPRTVEVIQARDGKGFPSGYSARIVTEVCMDKKCRLVEVTLFWNAVGRFARFEVPPAKPLTKKKHEPFTAADYAKLERILKDPDSILARHSLAYLAQPEKAKREEEDLDVDAWTGATPQTVRESVVEDAAYTTWVLWHWANGELAERLCHLTERSCQPPYLKHLLRSADRSCVEFALRFLSGRRPLEAQYVEDLLRVVETGDREMLALCLRVLRLGEGNREGIHSRLIRAVGRMSPVHSPAVLDFLASETELPAPTLEELTSYLGELPYFQIHLILRMLEQKRHFTAKTETDVALLLDGDDFFIARRACEFLATQKLSSGAAAKVRDFRERNRERL